MASPFALCLGHGLVEALLCLDRQALGKERGLALAHHHQLELFGFRRADLGALPNTARSACDCAVPTTNIWSV